MLEQTCILPILGDLRTHGANEPQHGRLTVIHIAANVGTTLYTPLAPGEADHASFTVTCIAHAGRKRHSLTCICREGRYAYRIYFQPNDAHSTLPKPSRLSNRSSRHQHRLTVIRNAFKSTNSQAQLKKYSFHHAGRISRRHPSEVPQATILRDDCVVGLGRARFHTLPVPQIAG